MPLAAAAASSTNELKQPYVDQEILPPVVTLKDDDDDQNQMKVSAHAPQKVDEPTNNNHMSAGAIPSNLSTSEVEDLIGTQLGFYTRHYSEYIHRQCNCNHHGWG